MKTTTLFTNCLTYDELSSYTTNKMEPSLRTQLYQHISTCELCSCAVNGFAAMPFASVDINNLYDKIDMKTNVKQSGPITFAQVCIVIICVFSIFAFYSAANFVQNKSMKTAGTTNKAISFAHLKVKPEVQTVTTVSIPASNVSKKAKHAVKKEETNTMDLNSTYAYQETEKMSNDMDCQPFKMK
jgi:hypothetical protein